MPATKSKIDIATMLAKEYYRTRPTGGCLHIVLDDGNIEELIDQARAFLPKDQRAGKDVRRELGYFEKNRDRMRYAQFKAQGMFVGSGVIEAGCKAVIGQRLKQSGMEWTVRGANAIIALRCATVSGRTEDYWEQRAA